MNSDASSVASTCQFFCVPSDWTAAMPAGIESCRKPAVLEKTSARSFFARVVGGQHLDRDVPGRGAALAVATPSASRSVAGGGERGGRRGARSRRRCRCRRSPTSTSARRRWRRSPRRSARPPAARSPPSGVAVADVITGVRVRAAAAAGRAVDLEVVEGRRPARAVDAGRVEAELHVGGRVGDGRADVLPGRAVEGRLGRGSSCPTWSSAARSRVTPAGTSRFGPLAVTVPATFERFSIRLIRVFVAVGDRVELDVVVVVLPDQDAGLAELADERPRRELGLEHVVRATCGRRSGGCSSCCRRRRRPGPCVIVRPPLPTLVERGVLALDRVPARLVERSCR